MPFDDNKNKKRKIHMFRERNGNLFHYFSFLIFFFYVILSCIQLVLVRSIAYNTNAAHTTSSQALNMKDQLKEMKEI